MFCLITFCEHKIDLFLLVRIDDEWLSIWVVLYHSQLTNQSMRLWVLQPYLLACGVQAKEKYDLIFSYK